MKLAADEQGQTLVVVLALVGLVAALAYGWMGLAATSNQQSTLRTVQLGEYRASDSGATYTLWYATQKGFPPGGALSAPDPGDGLGAPSVTVTDLRTPLSFGPLHSKNHGAQVYNSPAITLVGSGDVFFTMTWTSDSAGRGLLNVRFDTTAVQGTGFAAQTSATMPAGQVSTTTTFTLPTSGPGTYYLHIENATSGADVHLSSAGTFEVEYPGMRFQAIATRNSRTTALEAALTRNGGVYSATVNSWTLR